MTCKIRLYTFLLQTLLSRGQSFPSTNGAVNTWEELQTFLHECRNDSLNLIHILDDSLHTFLIECKALSHILKHTNKVNNQAALLILVIGTVCTADGL